VFFTPYRPWLYEKDMAFFELVREAGLSVEKVLERKMEKVMFDKDPGDEELRRTVFGYEVKWIL
jgi:EEF1A N-terminal glycine/lysine methyltransferase